METATQHKGAVGLGAVIIILLAGVLFIQGIHFSTTTVTNNSTNFFTTEGTFHVWSMVFNVTDQSAQLVYITDVALVENLSSNVTFVSLTTGLRLTSFTEIGRASCRERGYNPV